MSNKVRKKIVKVVKHDFEGGVKELLDRLVAFSKKWAESLNDTHARFNKLAIHVAQQMSQMWGNMQSVVKSIVVHDTSILAQDQINREFFGQLTQIDTLLEKLTTPEQRAEWLQDVEALKAKAAAWHRDTTAACFELVQKEQAEKEKQRQEEITKAVEEQKAKEEAERAAEAIRQAESPQPIEAQSGGQGATEIPEGAQVFGG
jgi:hypothetical protein